MEALARAVVRSRFVLIVSWIVVAAFAVPLAARVNQRLRVEGRSHPTESAEAGRLIKESFDRPWAKFFVVAVVGPIPADSQPFRSLMQRLSEAARRQAYIDQVTALSRTAAPVDRTIGRAAFFVASITPEYADSAAQVVHPFREAMRHALMGHSAATEYEIRVTGQPALEWDVHAVSVEDAKRGEIRALIPTAVVLVIAFGGVVASALPIVFGLSAITTALGVVYLVAPLFPMSVLVLPVVTMVGLAVGIDYSLFIITRFREEIARGLNRREAAVRSAVTAGRAVLTSGLTVVIGFGSLLLTRATETQSVGIAGVLVVAASVLLATTLMPAVLAAFGYWIDWPTSLALRLVWFRRGTIWARWSRMLAHHRWPALVIGLLVAAATSWPLVTLKVGSPPAGWFARDTESMIGARTLERAGSRGAVLPVRVVLRAPHGQRIVSSRYIPGLRRFSDSIRADSRVAEVQSPVDLRPSMSILDYVIIYSDLKGFRDRHPDFTGAYLSRSGDIALMHVLLADTVTAAAAWDLVRKIRAMGSRGIAGLDSVELMVTGFAAADLDEHEALEDVLPRVVGLVVSATIVMLFVAFRSVLVPLKALIMNGLSVAGAFGLMVLVFQHGVGVRLFGLTGPTESIYLVVLVMVFAVAFGLSMDYEVFLLSRIRESFVSSRNNERATVEGMSVTGPVITSAAAIMVTVFGTFAYSRVLAAQLMGFGLAVAVFLDATLIRMVLVPAFMHVAGRWNWWPGVRGGASTCF